MREAVFLALANHLPRMRVCDHFRHVLYRWAGMRIEGRCTLWGPLTIRPLGSARNIRIGAGSFVNTDVRFAAAGAIHLGSNVQVGPRVMFETVSHGLVYEPGKGRGYWARPIVVEDEVWIGAGAILTQGVTIGRGSVIAAGAVVTRDVAPGVIAAGVPAREIRPVDAAVARGTDTTRPVAP